MKSGRWAKEKEKRRRRKAKLMQQQNGLCYWCEVPMTPTLPPSRKPPPPTMATIDHLRCRFNPTRRIPPNGNEQRWVVACWECNNTRGIKMQKSQPIEVLREHSRRHQDSHA